jgi:hypothetical protein
MITDIMGNLLEPVYGSGIRFDEVEVPESHEDVLEWATTAERVLLALSVEESRGKPRKNLLKALTVLLPAGSTIEEPVDNPVEKVVDNVDE